MLADGLTTHIPRTAVDVERAAGQWQRYVAAMVATGWTVAEVPPATVYVGRGGRTEHDGIEQFRNALSHTEAQVVPVEVDISEFIKLEGCVMCLSVRLRAAPPSPAG